MSIAINTRHRGDPYVSRREAEHSHASPSSRFSIQLPSDRLSTHPANNFEAMVAAPKRPAHRKSNVRYNEQESSEPSDDGQDSDSPPPPRKRTRGRVGASGSKAKKRTKAKQTSTFLEMPLDVMFEVSKFLYAETAQFNLFPGFMARRSSVASSRKICCNSPERPRLLGASS